MDRQSRNKGYTVLEMIFVLAVLTICLLLCVPLIRVQQPLEYYAAIFENDLLYAQQISILSNDKVEVSLQKEPYQEVEIVSSNQSVSVNNKGNISHAQTIQFTGIKRNLEVKIWLGFGRVSYVKRKAHF